MPFRSLFLLVALAACQRASTARTMAPGVEAVSLLGVPLRTPSNPDGPIRAADSALARSPNDAELLLAAAGARATAWRFREAISLYSRGAALHPTDARFLRFRGHRYLTVRQFEDGKRDLDRAAVMDSTNFDIVYHQGLAHYLLGHFGRAADAYAKCLGFGANDALRAKEARGEYRAGYRSCMRTATDPEALVSMTDWAWRANARAGRQAEAARLLGTVQESMKVSTNRSYFENLLMYKGSRTPDQVLEWAKSDSVRFSTSGYAVASWLLMKGDSARGWPLMEEIARGPHWNGFGAIGAEVEVARRRR
jgi:tetratricopeptide (TPR) repeat protein